MLCAIARSEQQNKKLTVRRAPFAADPVQRLVGQWSCFFSLHDFKAIC